MVLVDFESNILDLEREAPHIARQVPFATSLALNRTIGDVRRVIITTTWGKAFEVRNRAFPNIVFKRKFSKKTDLEVILYAKDEFDYLTKHATGGTKTSTYSGRLAVPFDNIGRTSGGRIPKRLKPRALLNKKSTFYRRGPSGHNLIIETFKGETIIRYILVPSAQIDARFRFYQDALKVATRVLQGHWDTAMLRALRTAKTVQIK